MHTDPVRHLGRGDLTASPALHRSPFNSSQEVPRHGKGNWGPSLPRAEHPTSAISWDTMGAWEHLCSEVSLGRHQPRNVGLPPRSSRTLTGCSLLSPQRMFRLHPQSPLSPVFWNVLSESPSLLCPPCARMFHLHPHSPLSPVFWNVLSEPHSLSSASSMF